MAAHYQNAFGEWLRELLETHGIASSRQARARTGIAHTTIDDILAGRRPSVETALRIAQAFDASPDVALRKAGYEDLADTWSNSHRETPDGTGLPGAFSSSEPAETSEDEGELLQYYRRIPPLMRPTAKTLLKALVEAEPEYEEGRTFGKRSG